NPAAPILDPDGASVDRLLNCGLYDPDSKSPDVKRWLAEEAYASANTPSRGEHHHHHEERIRSFSLASEQPIPVAALDMFLELLRSLHGPKLLRVKGIVHIAETPQTPVVIHGVQHVFHPPAALAAWPDGDRRTRLVLITCDMDPRMIAELFNA